MIAHELLNNWEVDWLETNKLRSHSCTAKIIGISQDPQLRLKLTLVV